MISPYTIPGVNKELTISERSARRKFEKGRSGRIQAMMSLVSSFYKISETDIKSAWRKRPVVWARQVFCYLCYKYEKCPLREIADFINRDHSSVIHSRQSVEDLMFSDPILCEGVKELEKQIIISKIIKKTLYT